MHERTGSIVEMIDLSDLDSYSKSFLYVPAFMLKPGFYLFQFGLNMTSTYLHPVLPFYATGSTYVKIVPSPIIARLSEGAQSRVIRGWGQRLATEKLQASLTLTLMHLFSTQNSFVTSHAFDRSG